jgi:hypothetical protein
MKARTAAVVLAVLVTAALTGCTVGREPQARSAPAPVTAAAQASSGARPPPPATSPASSARWSRRW